MSSKPKENTLADTPIPSGASAKPGPAPAPELAGWRFDAVLLEETFGIVERKVPQHHNLESFAAAVADLRAWGNLAAAARVVAIHLGHDNPPEPDLWRRLAELEAECHPDLTSFSVG